MGRAEIKTSNGITIVGFTKHGIHRSAGGFDRLSVRSVDIINTLKNPLKICEVMVDQSGRKSQRFIGRRCEVVINSDSGKIVSMNVTSSKKVERLTRKAQKMEIKIPEPHLSFLASHLQQTNYKTFKQLKHFYSASTFNVNTNSATKLVSWVENKHSLKEKKVLDELMSLIKRSKKHLIKEHVLKLKLPRSHVEFLNVHLLPSAPDLFTLLQKSIIASYFELVLDGELVLRLHDWASTQLQLIGFDKDYNLTRSGEMLEDLMDIFLY